MTADGTYRPSARVTTAAELDALLIGSVVRHASGQVFARVDDPDDYDWRGIGSSAAFTAGEIIAEHPGPLTVLFRPDAPQPAATGDAVARVLRAVEAAIREMPNRYRPIDVADEIAQPDSPFRAALAAAGAGEARYAGPTYEQVWQAITGRDEPWGGCADREAVERVMALVLPARAAGAGAEVDRFRCPACRHWCAWVDDAWVCSKRGGCGAEYTPDRPADVVGEAVDREALIVRARRAADSLDTADADYCDHRGWDCARKIEAWADGQKFTTDDLRALAARGDAATPTVTPERLEAMWREAALTVHPYVEGDSLTQRMLRAFATALGIKVEGGEQP